MKSPVLTNSLFFLNPNPYDDVNRNIDRLASSSIGTHSTHARLLYEEGEATIPTMSESLTSGPLGASVFCEPPDEGRLIDEESRPTHLQTPDDVLNIPLLLDLTPCYELSTEWWRLFILWFLAVFVTPLYLAIVRVNETTAAIDTTGTNKRKLLLGFIYWIVLIGYFVCLLRTPVDILRSAFTAAEWFFPFLLHCFVWTSECFLRVTQINFVLPWYDLEKRLQHSKCTVRDLSVKDRSSVKKDLIDIGISTVEPEQPITKTAITVTEIPQHAATWIKYLSDQTYTTLSTRKTSLFTIAQIAIPVLYGVFLCVLQVYNSTNLTLTVEFVVMLVFGILCNVIVLALTLTHLTKGMLGLWYFGTLGTIITQSTHQTLASLKNLLFFPMDDVRNVVVWMETRIYFLLQLMKSRRIVETTLLTILLTTLPGLMLIIATLLRKESLLTAQSVVMITFVLIMIAYFAATVFMAVWANESLFNINILEDETLRQRLLIAMQGKTSTDTSQLIQFLQYLQTHIQQRPFVGLSVFGLPLNKTTATWAIGCGLSLVTSALSHKFLST